MIEMILLSALVNKKNNELESEVCDLGELKQKWQMTNYEEMHGCELLMSVNAYD